MLNSLPLSFSSIPFCVVSSHSLSLSLMFVPRRVFVSAGTARTVAAVQSSRLTGCRRGGGYWFPCIPGQTLVGSYDVPGRLGIRSRPPISPTRPPYKYESTFFRTIPADYSTRQKKPLFTTTTAVLGPNRAKLYFHTIGRVQGRWTRAPPPSPKLQGGPPDG